jgi:hypothetical protein
MQRRAGGPPLPFHGNFPPTGLPLRPLPLRSCPSRSSVKAFGARGDGRTSDVAALQRANRARGTSVLYFPPGTYRIASSLVLSKIVLAGEAGRGLWPVVPQSACRRSIREGKARGVWLVRPVKGSLDCSDPRQTAPVFRQPAIPLHLLPHAPPQAASRSAGTGTRFLIDRGATLSLVQQPHRAPRWLDPLFSGRGAAPLASTRLPVEACQASP